MDGVGRAPGGVGGGAPVRARWSSRPRSVAAAAAAVMHYAGGE